MRSQFSTFFLIAVVVTGCVTNRIELRESSGSGIAETIVSVIAYDEKGLPLVGAPLARRPSTPGDHFTLVRLMQNRPVISYDIAVVRQKPDFAKPFQAVYEWTGKGFEWGANATGEWASGFAMQAHNTEEAVLGLAIIVTPVTVGTVGGFVVGIVDGIKQTAVELGKVAAKGEQVITCSAYDYDGMNRLVRMRMLSPDQRQELVRTEFEYEQGGTIPVRTVVKSMVERKERDIR